jgi:cytochrome c-type biogenesis protein CcmH/NrfF
MRTGDTAWCKVMDKGPWGKRDVNGEWFNAATDRKRAKEEGRKARCPKCKYLAILDMGPTVAKAMKSKGRVKVRVRVWKNNPLARYLDRELLGK